MSDIIPYGDDESLETAAAAVFAAYRAQPGVPQFDTLRGDTEPAPVQITRYWLGPIRIPGDVGGFIYADAVAQSCLPDIQLSMAVAEPGKPARPEDAASYHAALTALFPAPEAPPIGAIDPVVLTKP